MVTAGGNIDSGRGRTGLVGEGDGGCAEFVRGACKAPSWISNSLPLDALKPSPNNPASGLTEAGLRISLPPLLTLLPVG